VRAEGRVEQSPERVFAFLSDLRNHWRLSPSFVEVRQTRGDGEAARVRIRGPLGVRRSARTRIVEEVAPRLLRGRADVGRGTLGTIRWELAPDGSGTRVVLAAEVERSGTLDRLLLALGGRWWLGRGLREAVRRLGELA
jgi:carbon monoxide dehydrogenase subunit G